MALDLECRHQVEEKYLSEEGKKVEINSQPKNINKLKKRIDFLNVRKTGSSIQGKFVIINFLNQNQILSRIGLTVSKKLGNSVKRNYIKRILRAILINNPSQIPKNFDLEIIPKKILIKSNYDSIQQDILNLLKKINS
tara:strand:- start:1673 stop:2086 length:414 start_codon:yes stop_codon:yes gene_type:complete